MTRPHESASLARGRKIGICPLWPETRHPVKALLKRQPRGEQERIFVNRCDARLNIAGQSHRSAHRARAGFAVFGTRNSLFTPV